MASFVFGIILIFGIILLFCFLLEFFKGLSCFIKSRPVFFDLFLFSLKISIATIALGIIFSNIQIKIVHSDVNLKLGNEQHVSFNVEHKGEIKTESRHSGYINEYHYQR